MTTAAAAPRPLPGRFELALAPALLTLGVTLLRLVLELAHAPAWLASREAGGGGALIGISWLPFVFGPWFALRIARAVATTKRRLTRLVTTLVVYGYLARIPVFALFFLDKAFGWGTHFAAPPPSAVEASFAKQAGMIAVAQLGFWPLGWTVVAGGLAGAVALAIARPRVESAVEA